jgi:hypothetical protein
MKTLPGDYVAGFVDGEGCFALNYRRDVRHDRKNKPVYYYWKIQFVITLRDDDKKILEEIRNSLGCGNVTVNRRGAARYQVSSLEDLSTKILPFFEKHSLRAMKRHDFELWKEALHILMRNRQNSHMGKKGFSKVEWDKEDLGKLMHIRTEMKDYKGGPGKWKWESHMSQNQHSPTVSND